MRRIPYSERKCKITLLITTLFISLIYTGAHAQSIFLKEGQSGTMFLGGFGVTNKYIGPMMGFGVSFNGFTELGLGYSSFSHDGIQINTFAVAPNFLIRKQSVDFPFNVEFSPGFARTHNSQYIPSSFGANYNDMSIISLGLAASYELKSFPDVHFIPQLHALYSLIFSSIPGKANVLEGGLDCNIGIDLSEHILLIIDPGLSVAFTENSTSGSIAGGIVIK